MSDVTLKIDNDLKLKIVQQSVVLKFFNSVTIENVVNVDVLETLLLTLPEYPNEAAAFAVLGANKLYWINSDTDTEFPFSLKKTRPA